MKLRESWRFAMKCMRLSYNVKTNLICMGLLAALGLVYEIFHIGGEGMGAYLLLVVSMYPAQYVNSLCGSQLVQSSPYKKTLMTSLPTALTFCSGIAVYLAVVVIEVVRACVGQGSMGHSSRLILLCGVLLLLLNLYVGVAYKYFAVSIFLLAVCMVGFYNLSGIMGDTALAQFFLAIPLPVALVIGLCCALLGGVMQYGVSLLVYKKPMSRRAIYGLLRQQA